MGKHLGRAMARSVLLLVFLGLCVPALASAWPAPSTISDVGLGASEPQVAVNRDGDSLAVWTQFDGSNQRVKGSFRPAGGKFGATETLSEQGQDAFQPQVGIDSSGNGVAVWTGFDGTNQRVQAAFRAHWSSFGTPDTLSEAGQDAYEPQVKVSKNGDAIVVWTRSDGSNLRVQSDFRPRWHDFLGPETISEAAEDAFQPQVGIDDNGNSLAVFTRFDGATNRIESAFRPRWDGFESPQKISPAGFGASEPQVAVSRSGRAVAVWTLFDGSNLRAQGAYRAPWDSFDSPETISAAGQDAFSPQVDTDRNGNALAVFSRFDGTNLRIQSAFRRHWDGFESPQTLSDGGQDAYEPQVAVAQNGDADVVWTRSDGVNLRVQSSFGSIWDGFDDPETLSAAGQDAFEPQVGIDKRGKAVAVWTRFDGTFNRIQAAFGSSWSGFGSARTISDVGLGASEPQVAVNRDGDSLAVWTQFDGSNQRVKGSFRPAGGKFGATETLSEQGQDAFQPQVGIDSSGNGVAVWTGFDGTNQRVQAAFRAHWSSFGTPDTLSEAGQDAYEPQVKVSKNGDAIVVWTRSDGSNLRVQSDFRPRWHDFLGPETISEAAEDAFQPQVGIDDNGNSLAVFTRFDGATNRIESAFRPRWDGFESPQKISPAGFGASEPQVAVSRSGRAVAVWTLFDGSNLRAQGAYRAPWDSFDSPETISAAGQDAFSPQVDTDRNGNALAVFSRFDGTNLRIQSAFRRHWDGFESPQTLSDGGQDAYEPQVAVAQNGDADVVWTRSDGVNLRVQSSFGSIWDGFDDPETLSAAGQDAFEPQVGIDKRGKAVAVWTRFDGTFNRIQAAFGHG